MRVLYLNIYISKNGTNSEHLDIKIELPDNCKAELGKIFTRTTYPRYAEKFKENKDDYVLKPRRKPENKDNITDRNEKLENKQNQQNKAETKDIVVEMEDGTTITVEASIPRLKAAR